LYTCPSIRQLKLDAESLASIEQINKITRMAQLGAVVTSGGVIARLFTRSVPLETAFNITQYDWKLFGESTNAWSVIQRNRVVTIANDQALQHLNDRAQFEFWRGIANGCMY